MIKCIIGTVIISSTTALIIYYMKTNNKFNTKNNMRDVETQTYILPNVYKETVTPPNETNLPEFISIEHSDAGDTLPRRTISLSSFFNYIRPNY
jgi:hypothetical protein